VVPSALRAPASAYFHVEAVEKHVFPQKFSRKKWRIGFDAPFAFYHLNLSRAVSVGP